MHGKEYLGGGLPFTVDKMQQKVWTIFPHKGIIKHSNVVKFVKN